MLDNNKWGYVLLIGSGLSTSAGIPTAYSISMDLIKKKYASMNSSKFSNLNDYEKWYYTETGKTNIDYSDIIDWYFNKNSDKRLYLKEIFEPFHKMDTVYNSKDDNAHKVIVKLVKEDVIKIIITTNFDRLMELHLEDIGYSRIIDKNSFIDQKPFIADWPNRNLSLIKICGDYLDTELKNTSQELSNFDSSVDSLLTDIFDNFGVIICGWSAKYDSRLREIIKQSYTNNKAYTNYWIDKYEFKEESKELLDSLDFKPIVQDGNDFFKQLWKSYERLKSEKFSSTDNAQVSYDDYEQKIPKIFISELNVTVNHNATLQSGAEYAIAFNYVCKSKNKYLKLIEIDFQHGRKKSLLKNLRFFKRVVADNIILYPGSYYGYGVQHAQNIEYINNNKIRIFFQNRFKIEQSGKLCLVFNSNCRLINTSKSGLYHLSIAVNNAEDKLKSQPYEIRDTIHFIRNNPIIFMNNKLGMSDDIEIRLVNNKIKLVNDIDTITIAFPIGFTIPENIDNNTISVSKHNFLQCLLKRIGFRNISKWYKIKIKPTVNGNLLTITLPMTIKECEKFDIRFDKSSGIKNPQTSCYYTIQVKTSAQNWYAASPPFPIS